MPISISETVTEKPAKGFAGAQKVMPFGTTF